MANYYIDLFPAYINAGDAKNQVGGGTALGIDVNHEIKAMYRLSCTFWPSSKKVAGVDVDANYFHLMNHLGFEYVPDIALLKQFGLEWRNSLFAGFSMTRVSLKTSPNADASDTGLSLLACTGLGYELTQHFSLFMDAGWHQSFYSSDFDKSKIYGIQGTFGVRFAFQDTNDIGSAY